MIQWASSPVNTFFQNFLKIYYLPFARAYIHFFFLKIIYSTTISNSENPMTLIYPYCQSISGIFLKFMPYQPVIKVSGINIVVMTVRNCMTLFCLMFMRD